jgi:CRISPR-associated protein Cas2
MWLFVFFDLPVNSAEQRKRATLFRKDLLKDGFGMMQFSVYARNCASGESAAVHINRVKLFVPAEGLVTILKITDKQFGDSVNLVGRKSKPPPPPMLQLEFF